MAAIRTEGLTKFYGKTAGIVDLDLEVAPGEIFGFLGPNGAGKSTTIRLLMDFIRPTTGRAEVLGKDTRTQSVEIHRRVGFLPGELSMYPGLTGHELIRYFAALRDLPDLSHAKALAARLGLDLSLTIKSYSSGNRQKLAIVQCLMHRPEVLIMDEPTNALDPLMQLEFHAMMKEARNEGATLFLSSHILPEVERIADRVAIVRDGTLVALETVEALRAKAVRRIELMFDDPVPAEPFARLAAVKEISAGNGGRSLTLAVEGSLDEVVKTAAAYTVINVVSDQGDLEDVFLAYYAAEGSDAG